MGAHRLKQPLPPIQNLNSGDSLLKAVAEFEQKQRDASFSERHSDLGKMINCNLCNKRHRKNDPLFLSNRAHAEQFGSVDVPSRTVMFAKKRYKPHHSCEETIPGQTRQIRNRLEKVRQKQQVKARNRQKLSRRINRGLVCH